MQKGKKKQNLNSKNPKKYVKMLTMHEFWQATIKCMHVAAAVSNSLFFVFVVFNLNSNTRALVNILPQSTVPTLSFSHSKVQKKNYKNDMKQMKYCAFHVNIETTTTPWQWCVMATIKTVENGKQAFNTEWATCQIRTCYALYHGLLVKKSWVTLQDNFIYPESFCPEHR